MSAPLVETYSNVHTALLRQLRTVAGLPETKYWSRENEDAKKPPVGTSPGWLRETFDAQPNEQASVGNDNRLIRHFGTWFVDLMVPKNRGNTLADQLRGGMLVAFAPGSAISAGGQVVTIRTAYPSRGFNTDDWYQAPFTITWRADNVTP